MTRKIRITGGEAKGRQIKVPNGIRPTQDKLRATIFDVLENKVGQGFSLANTTFIDLFAGSGSVGIEALSRGAIEAIFVEQSKKVIPVLKDNLKSLGYSDRSKIIPMDAIKVLFKVGVQNFEPLQSNLPIIIFADPPYNKGYVEKIVGATLAVTQNNKAGARPATTLIIEHSKHEPIMIGKHYKSGDSIITFISEER